MINGDYRKQFPLGKVYKQIFNNWFYDLKTNKGKRVEDTVFVLLETELKYYSQPDINEICQTHGKVLLQDGDVMWIYAIRPDTIVLVEE